MTLVPTKFNFGSHPERPSAKREGVEGPAFAFRHARTTSLVALASFSFSALAAQTPPAAPQQPQPHGTVIFSRSTDESGQTTTIAGPAAAQTTGKPVTAPTATDDERQALTFTAFDMDVHLRAAEQQFAARVLITVRNDGKSPLAHIPLQISSSLNWERIRIASRDVAYTVATLNSDVDHTGQLHEAAVSLTQPLAPGATLQLDATYSGIIAPSAQRLIALGAPSDVALRTDWDSIGLDFTGLRGFGNVVWYPASSVPVILGDGARVFDEMGEHRLRMSAAHFRLRLTVEFPHGHTPTVALINGHPAPLTVTEPTTPGPEVAGVATASFDTSALGFEAPSLFVAVRTSHTASNTTLYTLPDSETEPGVVIPPIAPKTPANSPSPAWQAWADAVARVTPFLQGWLGQHPRSQLAILDLPDPQDAPFEAGSLLVTPIRPTPPDQLEDILVHALTYAWMSSPRAWLSEGLAHFMGTLWLEKQSGREKALEALESDRTALALAEPSSPGESPGQPLAQAISPAYYRTKATYVFWMLRDLAGDPALSAALRAYNPQQDAALGLGLMPGVPGSFQKLLDQAGPSDDLSWFFTDWVDYDKGLPDIAIDNVFPSPAGAPGGISSPTNAPPTGAQTESPSTAGPDENSWLVAVDLSNSGYAAAEIPVTVRNALTSVTQRVLVPARSKATMRILIQGQPAEVQANDGTVPETEASIHIRKLSVP